MLPRKCKKCRCYVAPQLERCPRCRNRVPHHKVAVKPTKDEKNAARDTADEKLPHIHAKNMVWVPSAFALEIHKNTLDECKRRLNKADTVHERNAVRSEIRSVKLTLARADAGTPSNRWTSEIFRTKYSSVAVCVSPKGHRYVLASRDGPADLIVINRKKHRRGMPISRLLRFEKSVFARAVKQDKKETQTHTKRDKAKKTQRAKKRATVQKHTLL